METIKHEFPPYYDSNSKILILGTIPSVQSRKVGFYYCHPQNRFWKVLANLYQEEIPHTIEEKKQFLTHHHIALWDVLASCTIEGSYPNTKKEATLLPSTSPANAAYSLEKLVDAYSKIIE